MCWCEFATLGLDFDVKHLAATIHAVGRVNAVSAETCAVLWILSKLRKCECYSAAAFAAALLGLFAFWLTHRIF